ncbi:MAG: DUF485 domain-containing protein [Candidatus Omnitrophica bacterium]|nr:DUF485 domain-containing protein [Candidatus Omnitrophota bacterium]MBU1997187.1 DUF485 domain-containing protein [Candidatus Omnitrophota bacterium]MBU4333266.1 DUF485 domain-containing protein [Candidatus Omnitrophota bacterium]
MEHGPATNWEKDNSSDYKTKTGLKLFIIYCMIYIGFVAINTIKPKLMGLKIAFGLNLACIYGFGLIILAIIMGLIYNAGCSKAEDKVTNAEKGAKK